MKFDVLADQLRQQSGLLAKRDIQAAAQVLDHLPFPELGNAGMLGDDAALLPAQSGQLLLACEGMQPTLVEEDPWFAGWSSVVVNLSDIAAMGGHPLAVVNSVWSATADQQIAMLQGMQCASERYGVPIVGGHSNQQSPYSALSVAVLGVANGPVLSARSARAGDQLWLLVNQRGTFYRHYPFWDAASDANAELLRSHLKLLPSLAAEGLIHAAKDISMGGITGTAVMFAESCGRALTIELDAVERPQGVAEPAWLTCFPSFGFLLAVEPSRSTELKQRLMSQPELICCCIGSFGVGHGQVLLRRDDCMETIWDANLTLTGFGCANDDSNC